MESDKVSQSKAGISSIPSVSWLGWRVAAALIGGLVLRLWMLTAFPPIGGDSLIYGDLAKNILLHGKFAITDGSGILHSTLIRLPGYPLFLAACFRMFGAEHYNAVAFTQIALELTASLLLADFVRQISTPRAALNTLWLAALCPFTAVYTIAPLTESLTFDMICLALWSLERCLRTSSLLACVLFTTAISYAALLRPDGALVAIALWPALLLCRRPDGRSIFSFRRAILWGLLAVMPFFLWTARNWQVFHVVEPLAPRYANDPGEDPRLGWQHWVKTWCLDFACTNDVYWNVPGNPLELDKLPQRAFDSPQQQTEMTALIAEYNNNDYELTPEMDARFEQLAQQRTATHPLRTYFRLPLGRLADMTLRPRVENLPIDLRWWEYDMHRAETRFSWAYAALNAVLLGIGLVGLLFRPRLWPYMLAYLALRSLLLLTIEAPESRYTLEFFPVLFALGGITLYRIFRSRSRA